MRYFKDKIGSTGVLLLQETTRNYKKLTLTAKSNRNGKRNLKVQFFCHGKSNPCGALTAYFETGTFIVK